MSKIAQQPEGGQRGYEERDISAGKVAAVGIALMLLIVVGAAVSWLTFRYFAGLPEEGEPGAPLAQPQQLPPNPRLQVVPVRDLLEKRQAEERQLGSYGWVDREGGIVHIPIDQAMRLLVERRRAGAPEESKK